jgi:hypothetical protein
MKLRIRGNSIRFRLLRSEVERLGTAGVISEEVRFGAATFQALRYSIAASDGVDEVTIQYSDNQILVLLPRATAMTWATSNDVGIDASIDVGNGEALSVLIEKDFECIGRPDDPDRVDAYPNPELTCEGEAPSG